MKFADAEGVISVDFRQLAGEPGHFAHYIMASEQDETAFVLEQVSRHAIGVSCVCLHSLGRSHSTSALQFLNFWTIVTLALL